MLNFRDEVVSQQVMSSVEGRLRLQRRIGYTFRNQALLGQALTHSSYTGGKGVEHNERLEFLGDSVLDLICAEYLYLNNPGKREGYMSQVRAELVRKCALAQVARELGLGELMLVASSQQNIRRVDSVLADCLEAVVGAVFLDGGLEAAKRVAHANLIENPNGCS